MKKLKQKTIISLITALVVIAGCFFVLRAVNEQRTIRYRIEQRSQRISGIEAVFRNMEEDRIRAHEEYEAREREAFDMETVSLRQKARAGQYTGPAMLENGAVCQVGDGMIRFPEGMPFRLNLTAEMLNPRNGEKEVYVEAETENGQKMVRLRFEEISDGVFFISWLNNLSGEGGSLDSANSMESAFAEIGGIYDGCLAAFDGDGKPMFLSDPGFFPAGATFASLNLSAEASSEHPGIYRSAAEADRPETREPWYYIPVSVHIDGLENTYFFFRLGLDDPERTPDFAGQALIVCGVLGIIAAGLIVWLISVQKMVRDSILDAEQFKRYAPARIRRQTAICCAAGVLLVLAAAAVANGMDSLRVELVRSSDLLGRIADDTDRMEERQQSQDHEKEETVLHKALRLRDMLENNPALMTRENLAGINSILGSEYIMVFDHQGREIACSTDYTDFTLGENPEAELYPFRRLTMGLEFLLRPARVDEVTGQNLAKAGVRLKTENGFGAVILALDPALLSPASMENTHAYILRAATQQDCVSFAADQETGAILYASEESLTGRDARALGLGDMMPGDHPMGTFSLNHISYYGVSADHGGREYFYFFNASFLTRKMTPFIWIAAGFALALCALLSMTLHRGYTQEEYETLSTIGREVYRGRTVEIVTADGRIKKSVDPSVRWTGLGLQWKKMTPEQKARMALEVSLLALGLMILGMNRGPFESGLYRFIMAGQWQRGMNLLALGKTVSMICGAMMGLTLIRLIITAACQSLGSKGETVLRMLYNLLQYVAAFALLYDAFLNFGLETGGLIGAIGAVTLAVSLGSRDAMSDIIAGMNIVLEGEFQVGDIVQIGDAKGKVMDVGIRTTKLLCQGENVRVISNRNISSVTNLSRFNSWYAIQISVSAECDVAWLENLLQRELPAIGQRIRNILSGPIYKGVESIGPNSYTILLLAECREENLNNVHRSLNREIRMMLEREKIPLK